MKTITCDIKTLRRVKLGKKAENDQGGSPGRGGSSNVKILADPDEEDTGKEDTGKEDTGKEGTGKEDTGKEGKGLARIDLNGAEPFDEMTDEGTVLTGLEGSDIPNTDNTKMQDIATIDRKAREETAKITQGTRGKSVDVLPVDDYTLVDKNYRQALTDMMSQAVNSTSRTYFNPTRRSVTQQYTQPGPIKKLDLGNIIVALDTSGSITKQIITKFIGTVQDIATKNFKGNNLLIRVILYTEEIYKTVDFKPDDIKGTRLASWLMTNIDKSGGNYFPTVMKQLHLMKDLPKFKGIIYLTDGYEVFNPGFVLPEMKNVFLIAGPVTAGNKPFIKYVEAQRRGGFKTDVWSVHLGE